MDTQTRFLSKVSPEALSGCWLWTSAYSKTGYPVMNVNYKVTKASRISYSLFKGIIDEGNYIRHLCHNPGCVNPAHLEQGTQKQNMYDSLVSGRLKQKLTNEDVASILKEYVPFEVSLNMLAKKYKVSKRNILDIVKGRKFKHIFERINETTISKAEGTSSTAVDSKEADGVRS